MGDIIGLDGKRASSDKPKPEEKPEPRDFEIALKPFGDTDEYQSLQEFGFLMVSPAYLMITGEDDKMKLIIPSDNVLFIRELDLVDEE